MNRHYIGNKPLRRHTTYRQKLILKSASGALKQYVGRLKIIGGNPSGPELQLLFNLSQNFITSM